MNNTQIKNGDVRIFPFYKGEYMGRSEVEYGFSNEASARKYMRQIPSEDVLDSIGVVKNIFRKTLIYISTLRISHIGLILNIVWMNVLLRDATMRTLGKSSI